MEATPSALSPRDKQRPALQPPTFLPYQGRQGLRLQGRRQVRQGLRLQGRRQVRQGLRLQGRRQGLRLQGRRQGLRLQGRLQGRRQGLRLQGRRQVSNPLWALPKPLVVQHPFQWQVEPADPPQPPQVPNPH